MQNFKNHSRFLTLWHFILVPVMITSLVFSVINFVHASRENHIPAAIILALNIMIIFIWYYSRRFALVAQDRAIRAEESLRHFIITGKPINPQLRLGQIIALRFAPDDEVIALSKKAVSENLTAKAIKAEIRNWKEDNHRV